MALADLLKPKSSAEKLEKMRHLLSTELLEANENLDAARRRRAPAVLDEFESPADSAAAAEAEAKMIKARDHVDRLTAALAELDYRVNDQNSRASSDLLEAAWFKSIDLAEERQAQIVEMSKTMQKLADQLKAIQKTSTALVNTLPKQYDPAGAMLHEPDMIGRVAADLTRMGMKGDAHARAFHGAKSLLEFSSGIPDLVREWRERHLGGARG